MEVDGILELVELRHGENGRDEVEDLDQELKGKKTRRSRGEAHIFHWDELSFLGRREHRW